MARCRKKMFCPDGLSTLGVRKGDCNEHAVLLEALAGMIGHFQIAVVERTYP